MDQARRPSRQRWYRPFLRGGLVLLALYLVLLIPGCDPELPTGPGGEPFVWDRQAFWSELESRFIEARQSERSRVDSEIETRLAVMEQLLESLSGGEFGPDDPIFSRLEEELFRLAPLVAAVPERLLGFADLSSRGCQAVKRESIGWSMSDKATRQRLYALLYGSRAAFEEAMLQAEADSLSAVLMGEQGASITPSAIVQGVRIHSGDVLVSRGGAATSALIARGNDHPGNFSHVALAHVSEHNGQVTVIEAHIESGVSARPIEGYLEETKLRIMLLRLREDLPALMDDPQLPHRAATRALEESNNRHIPYDFAMDYGDPEKQFCSEVASAAYRAEGVELWMGVSHLSSPGLIRWLSRLGVRHFETQEPSDLEYDPQLVVVAEWRDPETLFQDHVDNAVIDALLQSAEAGEPLDYQLWLLPVVRVTKGYSVVKNLFGGVGPVPEGMSATTALRVRELTRRHESIREMVMLEADQFRHERGYSPPYWELVRMAVEAREAVK